MNHLVILRPGPMEKILQGTKTIESRFGINRPPAWQCTEGDTLYLKVTGGNILATARARQIERYDELDAVTLYALESRYRDGVHGGVRNLDYWLDGMRRGVRYAVFIHLEDLRECLIPASQLPATLPYASAWIARFQPPHAAS